MAANINKVRDTAFGLTYIFFGIVGYFYLEDLLGLQTPFKQMLLAVLVLYGIYRLYRAFSADHQQ